MKPEQGEDTSGTAYVLHLYITGVTPNSTRAVRNLKDICDRYLAGRYELQIVDIYQQPEKAQEARIVAAPTLVKRSPGGARWLVGDLSDRERVLALLDLTPDPNDPYLHG
ncbi:circadian clock KaiB family protein [Hymenobacter crusticola]|uniref:Circadian clock protein KaiB n=1 Tax=Hymenobacter crusticola TaxID=1770526 RepID=A0A243WAM8_9BACT|nr:circadian clock KaiB family protein [Hymenobacter crusticola]OUJ72615.1 circadian clock protein KaiB [Hymenobacter crusticola]